METTSTPAKPSKGNSDSLLQLDPTPIEADALADALADAPGTPSSSRSNDLACSRPHTFDSPLVNHGSSCPPNRTGGGPIFFLSRVQRYSSITLSIFTSIHLANTSLIPLFTRSVSASEMYLLQAREVYQTSLSEPLLVGFPVLAHIAAGIALRFVRRSQNLGRYATNPALMKLEAHTSPASVPRAWPALSFISISGYVFLVFFAAHITINRIIPLAVEGDSSNIGLAFVAHGFSRHTALSTVSYLGLLITGCSHIVWGVSKWLSIAPDTAEWTRRNGARVPKGRRRAWFSIHATSLAFAMLWAAGGLGIVGRGGLAPGWVGKLYDGLYTRVWL